MDKIDAGLIGMVIGACASVGSILYSPPAIDRAEIFQRDNKPAVMRMYRTGGDGLYVASSNNNKNYISSKYLEKIANEADRKIEEAEIKKITNWYNK